MTLSRRLSRNTIVVRQSQERELQVRFLKIMTRVLFGNPDAAANPIAGSFNTIDWDTAPMVSVRMGFNDFVEMTQDISGEALEAIDTILNENGAYTLTQARDKGYCRVMQLMGFSKIKKEEDAFLIKSIVDSVDSRFTQDQLVELEELLETYRGK